MAERNYKYTGGRFTSNLEFKTEMGIWNTLISAGLNIDKVFTQTQIKNIFVAAKLNPDIVSLKEAPTNTNTRTRTKLYCLLIRVTIPNSNTKTDVELHLS